MTKEGIPHVGYFPLADRLIGQDVPTLGGVIGPIGGVRQGSGDSQH